MSVPAVGVVKKVAAQSPKYAGNRVPRGTKRARKAAATATPTAPAPTPANPDKSTPAAKPPAANSQIPAKTGKSTPAAKTDSVRSIRGFETPQPVSTGAGFLLALMFWSWVALPFLNNGGMAGVRAQLKAKFTNKAPDGSWLP